MMSFKHKHLYLFLFLFSGHILVNASISDTITLNWLENAPLTNSGVSWGVPWSKNIIKKDQTFKLIDSAGKPMPLQSWVLAFWPDGSVKWSGFATIAGSGNKGPFKLVKSKAISHSASVKVSEKKMNSKLIQDC